MALGKKLDKDALLRDLRGDELGEPPEPDAPRTRIPSREAVEMLHTDEEWARFFQVLCEDGPDAIRSQAWQWRDELEERGRRFDKTEVEDVLLDLAHELLPDSPAGAPEAWHEARDALWHAARSWFTERGLNPYDFVGEDLSEAWESLPALRGYLRGRMRAALAKLEAA